MDTLLYLSAEDVETVGPSMAEMIELLESAFREKGAGRVEMPPKPGIHPGGGDNFIHAMPAYIPAQQAAGIKWVGGFPDNPPRGLPYISGLLILNDPETGVPLVVMDCGWITARRTGAATAVAAKYLARTNSSTVGILACGVQGRTNLEALRAILPLTHVRAYDLHRHVAERYAREMSRHLELEIEVVDEPERAVRGCDVVVTSGPIQKTPHATIRAGWLEEGAFASLVDFDSYWHAAALAEIDTVCTDDLAQFLYYRETGFFQNTPEIHADLGELATGRKTGRSSASERTMTINLGLAMEDMVVARQIYLRAVEEKRGVALPR